MKIKSTDSLIKVTEETSAKREAQKEQAKTKLAELEEKTTSLRIERDKKIIAGDVDAYQAKEKELVATNVELETAREFYERLEKLDLVTEEDMKKLPAKVHEELRAKEAELKKELAPSVESLTKKISEYIEEVGRADKAIKDFYRVAKNGKREAYNSQELHDFETTLYWVLNNLESIGEDIK